MSARRPIRDAAALVLAGGRGTRLGGVDKALLSFAGGRLVDRVLGAIGPLFDEVVLVAAAAEPYADLGLPVAIDRHPGAGPLAGLEAGLSAISSPRAFAVACDMPAVSPDLVRFLAGLDPGAPAVVPVAGGRLQPLHAFYRADLAPAAGAALEAGDRKLERFLDRVGWRRVEEVEFAHVPGAARSFDNLNTPEDRRALEAAVAPGPLLGVAGPANDSGKTTLVCRVLEAYPGRFAAVKAITVEGTGRFCPSDGTTCACHRLTADYEVLVDPETIEEDDTDTGRMVRAGARRVVWGLATPGAHARMWSALAPHLPAGVPVLCEGLRVLEVSSPAGLVFVFDPSVPRRRWKEATAGVLARADWVVVNRRRNDGAESAENLAWLAERAPARRIDADLSRPLTEWAPSGFLTWIESALRS